MKKYSSKSNQKIELIHINSTKIPACKFCGSAEQGECLSSCKKRPFLKGFRIEYASGIGQNGLTNFLQKMKHAAMLESSTSKPIRIIEIGENSKSRHFFLH